MKPLAYIHRISKHAFSGANGTYKTSHNWQQAFLAGLYLFSSAFFCNGLCSVPSADSGHHCCPSVADTSAESADSEARGFTGAASYAHINADLCGDSHPRTLTDTVQSPKYSVVRVFIIPSATDILKRSWRPHHHIKSLESSNILLRTQKMLV